MSEADISKKAGTILKYRGIFNYKTSDRYHSGVPDIYVAGGRWIETKLVDCIRHVDVASLPRPEQVNFARNLVAGGDEVWLLAAIRFNGSKPLYWFYKFPFEKQPVTQYNCHPTLELALAKL